MCSACLLYTSTWAWKPTREMLEGSYSAPVCLQKEAGCFRAERGDAFLELSGGEMGGLGPCGRSGLFSVETSFRMQGKRRVQAMLGYFPKEHRFRIHAESTGSPVSYTHLDVYKRQVFVWKK